MMYQRNESATSRIQLTTSTCVLGLGLALAVFAAPALAKGYKQLYAFQGGTADGAEPLSALLAYKGDFYGTTCRGGADGAGTIFKVAHDGNGETPLYSFTGGSDGFCPEGPLVADKSGNFYAVAGGGGSTNCSGGCGTVVEFAPPYDTPTVLHTFQGGSDGAEPNYGVVMGKKGNLYGTTSVGGVGSCNETGYPSGCGTVFQMTQSNGVWSETVLYSFEGGTGDGAIPLGNLLSDSSGNLYGTTNEGGVTTCVYLAVQGCGTVFKLAPDGTEKILYNFCSLANCADGAGPVFEPLIMDKKGSLYGTTSGGGAYCESDGQGGCGTVFKLAPDGTEKILYNFCSLANCADGEIPLAALIFDDKGNLYSTTNLGGTSDQGTVFKLAPDGTETVLYSFAGSPDDGADPWGTLIADKSGNLYGTTVSGGDGNCQSIGLAGCGTIFKVKE
jgi:uncharacterized repeat protein (TIGR03803 family)